MGCKVRQYSLLLADAVAPEVWLSFTLLNANRIQTPVMQPGGQLRPTGAKRWIGEANGQEATPEIGYEI